MSLAQLQKSILASLKSQSGDFGLYFREITAESNLPKAVSIGTVLGSQELAGFGVADTKDKAAFCASMELIERLIFHRSNFTESFQQLGVLFSRSVSFDQIVTKFKLDKNVFLSNKTTSGLAVHTNKNEAIESAIDELIERHVILKSMATRVSPMREPLLESRFLDYLLPKEVSSDFFICKGPVKRFVVIFRIQRQGKTCYGFGSNKNLLSAKKKAFFEATPRLRVLLEENSESVQGLSLGDNFKEHFSKDCHWTRSWLECSSALDIPSVDCHLNRSSIFIQNIELPTELKEFKNQIFVVKAMSPFMQPLFAGDWSQSKINKLAIGEDLALPPEMHLVC